MGLVSLLFSFKGRINRLQYWLGSIGISIGLFVLTFVLSVTTGASLASAKDNPAALMAALASFGLLFGPVMIVAGWCGLALQVKRFHDRGRSGLWTLLPLLPIILITIAVVTGVVNDRPAEAVSREIGNYMLLLWAINLGFFIDLGCLPSKDGPNKDGNPPGSPPSSAPRAPSAAPNGNGAPASAASSLLSAQAAIDRAIAERARQPQPAPGRAAAAAPRSSISPAPAGAPAFGRRVTR